MRFRLPKPLHGWRDLAWEVSIIVIGVLIALSAQQLLEDWNWRQKTDVQGKALDEDVSKMWDAMSARMVMQRCVDTRLKELELVFQRHNRGQPLGLEEPIGRPAVWTASQAALRMATADGSLSHMPMADKRAYFEVAESYDTFAPIAQEERASWRVLQALNDPESLDATDWRELRSAYRDAVDSSRVMKTNLVSGDDAQWLTAFTRFPRHPQNNEALTLPFVQELCRPAVRQ